MTAARLFASLAGLSLLGAVLGCGGSSSAPVGNPPPVNSSATPVAGAPATGPADGKQVFDQNCAKCHPMDGVGGKAKNPDLGKAGTKHDTAWIVEHTKNPKTHKPQSGMPAFEGKLSAEQLKAVGDYLAAKK